MRVDVVTAVHDAYAVFLPAAWRSLRAQTYQDWTWLVQVDGPYEIIVDTLARCGASADARVLLAVNGTWEGPATTRNVALGRASAPVVQNLDADDELEPTALSLLASALRAHPEAGFAVGRARDLLPSGELRDHPLPLEAGILARGALVDHWVTDPVPHALPVHPAGVLWRRQLLQAAGGWSALSGMEDTGLLMAASAMATGMLVDTPILRYRKHPGQRSAKRSKFTGGGAQIALVRQRAALLRRGPKWIQPAETIA